MRRFDIVSVDVWDTILRRSVHPNEVKIHVARWLQLTHPEILRRELASDLWGMYTLRNETEAQLGREAAATGDDDEYEITDVFRRWLHTVSAPGSPIDDRLVDELLREEMAFERRTTSLDPGILGALRPYADVPLVIASDFYMGADRLMELVRASGFDLPVRAVYVSCDRRRNKRGGRLFTQIQADLGVSPQRHLHVGDNPHSDVAIPRSLGMRAIHYRHPVADDVRARNEARFAWREKGLSPVKLVREAQSKSRAPRDLAGHARECFELGVRHGFPFIAFVLAVIEDAIRKKHDCVHYFTREGVFFRRIHDAIARSAPFPKPVPPSRLLAVSRVSTFAAALGAIAADRAGPRQTTADDMMGIWRLYQTQSMAAMMTSLGEDPRSWGDLFARHGLDGEVLVERPWLDPAVLALFRDQDFQSRLAVALDGRRARTLRYLASAGLRADTPRAAIVDIGWRGTIQDNLAVLLPRTLIEGWYLGLDEFRNPQPANVKKHGVLCDRNASPPSALHLALKIPSVVEMLCNSATGSAVDYASGEGAEPVTERHPGEDKVWLHHVQWFQQGILALVPHLSDGLRGHPIHASELLEEARRELGDLLARPPAPLARAYFELTHNEGFGLGGFVEKRARVPRSAADLERSGWPQGLLRHLGLRFLLGWWNHRVLRLDRTGHVHR